MWPFDARPADKDVSGDPRTLALSLGSVQILERLGAWRAELAQTGAPVRSCYLILVTYPFALPSSLATSCTSLSPRPERLMMMIRSGASSRARFMA